MLMGLIWTAMIVVSILFGCLNGSAAQVQQAALDGAAAAIELCLGIGGAVCLWCAVMELMRTSGLADALSRALRPALRRLFPESSKHESVMQPLSANVSANLLGLGNHGHTCGTGDGTPRFSGRSVKRAVQARCIKHGLHSASAYDCCRNTRRRGSCRSA